MATASLKNILFLHHLHNSGCPIPRQPAYPASLFETSDQSPHTHTRAQARARMHCELRGETLDSEHGKRPENRRFLTFHASTMSLCSPEGQRLSGPDRKSTRLNSSH